MFFDLAMGSGRRGKKKAHLELGKMLSHYDAWCRGASIDSLHAMRNILIVVTKGVVIFFREDFDPFWLRAVLISSVSFDIFI